MEVYRLRLRHMKQPDLTSKVDMQTGPTPVALSVARALIHCPDAAGSPARAQPLVLRGGGGLGNLQNLVSRRSIFQRYESVHFTIAHQPRENLNHQPTNPPPPDLPPGKRHHNPSATAARTSIRLQPAGKDSRPPPVQLGRLCNSTRKILKTGQPIMPSITTVHESLPCKPCSSHFLHVVPLPHIRPTY